MYGEGGNLETSDSRRRIRRFESNLREVRMNRFVASMFLCVVSSTLYAQSFNNQWVEFTPAPNAIQNSSGGVLTALTTTIDEKDFAWGDLNNDGWTDLVVVLKEPITTTGKRRNYLLMNEGGILVDRSLEYASDSDVGGDLGFRTPTNDRDVVIVDINNDGWLDVVTATTLSDGDAKHLSHPRVYRNEGESAGVWQGLRFENFRFPQLMTTGGLAVSPRFCSVSAGDVTGDGFADLYFTDYDTGETGPPENPTNDLNDRLLINNGSGTFIDQSSTRMSATMLSSAFGMSSDIADMNGDGVLDVVKDTALGAPQYVSVAYNNPANEGFFNLFQNSFHAFSPYHLDTGDLNNDGRLDLVVSDDGDDRYRYNLGNDGLGRVNWGAAKTFQFLDGGDDGFAGNTLIVDLNNDNWNDIVFSDVDVDVVGCSRRAHIYHNPGGTVGSEITLREEVQQAGSGGWKGVKGLLIGDLTGTFDVAVFDINNDGWKDMVFGRCNGTFVWMNVAPNQAPIVSAGIDQEITLPAQANLDGTASDMTLPMGPLATTWSKFSGPGTVMFGNANAVDTTASFSVDGVYVLRLTASDGLLQTSDDMQVTVNAQAPLLPCDILGVGARAIRLTPNAGSDPIALRITSADFPCFLKYVAADSSLVDTPVYRLPSEWGTVYVRGGQIVPLTDYEVRSESVTQNSTLNTSTTYRWGDTRPNDIVNLDDILCILTAFGGSPVAPCTLYSADLIEPMGNINLDDILAVLMAFGGAGYPGPLPCP